MAAECIEKMFREQKLRKESSALLVDGEAPGSAGAQNQARRDARLMEVLLLSMERTRLLLPRLAAAETPLLHNNATFARVLRMACEQARWLKQEKRRSYAQAAK